MLQPTRLALQYGGIEHNIPDSETLRVDVHTIALTPDQAAQALRNLPNPLICSLDRLGRRECLVRVDDSAALTFVTIVVKQRAWVGGSVKVYWQLRFTRLWQPAHDTIWEGFVRRHGETLHTLWQESLLQTVGRAAMHASIGAVGLPPRLEARLRRMKYLRLSQALKSSKDYAQTSENAAQAFAEIAFWLCDYTAGADDSA